MVRKFIKSLVDGDSYNLNSDLVEQRLANTPHKNTKNRLNWNFILTTKDNENDIVRKRQRLWEIERNSKSK